MTRKKWTKLRRQKPHLFGALPPFEKWNDYERNLMKSVGKPEALATMTAWWLSEPQSDDEPAKTHWWLVPHCGLEPIISYDSYPQ